MVNVIGGTPIRIDWRRRAVVQCLQGVHVTLYYTLCIQLSYDYKKGFVNRPTRVRERTKGRCASRLYSFNVTVSCLRTRTVSDIISTWSTTNINGPTIRDGLRGSELRASTAFTLTPRIVKVARIGETYRINYALRRYLNMYVPSKRERPNTYLRSFHYRVSYSETRPENAKRIFLPSAERTVNRF